MIGEPYDKKYAAWREMLDDEGWQKDWQCDWLKGWLEGWLEGWQEGVREGYQLTIRRVLKRQAELRFGELPDSAAARIDQATEAEVEQWIERILQADSLASLLER
jgi:hypothetical protein